MNAWLVDANRLPGPDREKWPVDDLLAPSPGNAFAVMIYSYTEFSLHKMVGNLAVYEGPPSNPKVVFLPPRFECAVWDRDESVQWLSDTTCVVWVWSLAEREALPRGFCGRAYLDLDNRTVGLEKSTSAYPPQRVGEVPVGLTWYSWGWVERHWQTAKYARALPPSDVPAA